MPAEEVLKQERSAAARRLRRAGRGEQQGPTERRKLQIAEKSWARGAGRAAQAVEDYLRGGAEPAEQHVRVALYR